MSTRSVAHAVDGGHAHQHGGPDDPLPLQLVDVFNRLGPAYVRWMRSCVPDDAPTLARMRLLDTLECRGPQIMSDLSTELGVTPRNVTFLVDGLEGDGLVARRPHPTDRRATIIELTPRAEKHARVAYHAHRSAVAEIFSGLSEAEQRRLFKLMVRLAQRLESRGSAAAS